MSFSFVLLSAFADLNLYVYALCGIIFLKPVRMVSLMNMYYLLPANLLAPIVFAKVVYLYCFHLICLSCFLLAPDVFISFYSCRISLLFSLKAFVLIALLGYYCRGIRGSLLNFIYSYCLRGILLFLLPPPDVLVVIISEFSQ